MARLAVWFSTLSTWWKRLGLHFRGILSGPPYLLFVAMAVPTSRLNAVPSVKWQDIVPLLSTW